MPEGGVAPAAQILRIEHSAVFLPESASLRRQPRAPNRKRPEKFWAQFEDRALFYDCFWHENGRDILLVSPPPCNLLGQYQVAKLVAQPSGEAVSLEVFPARSTMVSVVRGAPPGTTALDMKIGGQHFVIPVQANHADKFAGKRLLFTMNKDNDLEWVAAWAKWYAVMHGTNAIIVFDNGSTAYSLEDLEKTLAQVDGIETVCVISWPYSYGPHDPGVIFHRYWANFLQVSSFVMMFRRLASQAYGMVNADVDELVGNDGGASAYERAKSSPEGLVIFKGTWVESIEQAQDRASLPHFAYRYRHRNKLRTICANKWALDPSRDWCADLNAVPGVHRIYGVARSRFSSAPRLNFWHFKAINTQWKQARATRLPLGDRQVRLTDLDSEIDDFHGKATQ